MRRDPGRLSEKEYDLVVVGGGIFGICTAYDAAQRGLSVALLEKGDFAHATSANSFKIVHGGIRYLQHGDLRRLRESVRERRTFLRIAPHLVEPLPIVIPTYGYGAKGKPVLAAGLTLYDVLAFDRNRGIRDPRRRIPRGRFLSREEVLELFPGLPKPGLTGAGLFYDAQMYNPTRLALAFLCGATRNGADAANYVEVTGFIQEGGRVRGVEAVDRFSGERIEIRAKVVVNAAGPWAAGLLARMTGGRSVPPLTFSRDACFVVRRRLSEHPFSLAVSGKTRDPDTIVSRSARHLFIVPWREFTLVGVWHKVHRGSPDDVALTRSEVQDFVDEINWSYPGLGLGLEDISMLNFGLVLFGENEPGAVDLRYGKRSELIDHARQEALEGLVTLVGVRYTTARGVAEDATDLVFRKLGRPAPRCMSGVTPVPGGDITDFDGFLRSARTAAPPGLGEKTMVRLARNHGTEYAHLLRYGEEDTRWLEQLPGSRVIRAEVRHAVSQEMAVKLADVVFRRTDLGTGGHPGRAALRACAEIAGGVLGWDEEKIDAELADVEARLSAMTPTGGSPQHTPPTGRSSLGAPVTDSADAPEILP